VTWALFADRFSSPSPESAARGFAPRGETAGRLTRAIAERYWLPALILGRNAATEQGNHADAALIRGNIEREFSFLAESFLREPK
jgi:hypothetical protein